MDTGDEHGAVQPLRTRLAACLLEYVWGRQVGDYTINP